MARWCVTTWFSRVAMASACIGLVACPLGGARAAGRQTLADIRCVVVAIRMMSISYAQDRSAGMMAALYYLGRLDGHAPTADLARLLDDESRKMTLAEFRANAGRCGSAMKLKARQIDKIAAGLGRNGP